jgi:hypothetical protein
MEPGRPRSELLKLDASNGRRLERMSLGGDSGVVPRADSFGVAASDRAVWTRHDAVVTERDDRGRVVSRVRGISPALGVEGQRTMVADGDGVWVAGQADGSLFRIGHGQVVSRIKVGLLAGVIARTRSAVGVTAMFGTSHYELARVDPDKGTVTGRVALGSTTPQTIVLVGKQGWVITDRGDVVRVSQG